MLKSKSAKSNLLNYIIYLGAPQKRVPTLDGRIVGGHDANIAQYPYQVSIQYHGSHFCGGSIISSTWILTAAHCMDSVQISAVTIRAGSSNRNSGGAVVSVSRAISHQSYNGRTIDYDISLLQLSSGISTANARAIALPSAGSGPVAGATCTITGWGTLRESGSAPSVLQVVQVPVVSQANCRSAYGSSSITDRMFCAGLLGVGGKDACQGDSGGPVIVGGTAGGHRLVG
ncbi:hypothetical protein NQ318_022840 [Aromia moschata]|uniref:Peptidase S1 domain-containing protein n=1 Tax=Aromia moschata TaxID=1265417 RepID=A0AAV8XV98_9CUCU|nr:hypothetical protein NQ318_022840 [Aromia moschata]